MQARTRRLWTLFLWSLMVGPIAVLLHELGHWIVAVTAGFQPVLHAYAVSGVPETGPFGGDPAGVAAVALAGRLKSITDIPVLVGVGVSNAQQAVEATKVADGVIQGASVMRRMLESGPDSVGEYVAEVRRALDLAHSAK